jgi:hypothetical protein
MNILKKNDTLPSCFNNKTDFKECYEKIHPHTEHSQYQ